MISEVSIAISASVLTASEKSASARAPMPPVSTRSQGMAVKLQGEETRSRVTPGSSCTIEMLRPAKRLNKADLPTLGRPTSATTGFRILGFIVLLFYGRDCS